MKKIYYIIFLFILCLLSSSLEVKADEACKAKVILHYHRFDEDYNNYELYTWGNKNYNQSAIIDSKGIGSFGAKFEIPICESANNEIGIIIKNKESWIQDGIDSNHDGEIDNKYINVSDLKGTANTMNVYLLEGASEVYYRNPLKDTYFSNPGYGHLIVIYYNPEGNEGWDDFWTWGTGTGAKSEDITFDYRLGLSGGTDPNLFKVGIINIAKDSDDQIGLVIRKDRSWEVRNIEWAAELNDDITDENGHTYLKTGNILVNVTDIKGSGYKFIFIVNGERLIFDDFNDFKDKAFELTIANAHFKNKRALSIVINKNSAFDGSSIDITNFHVKNQNGEDIPIEYLSYDSSNTEYNEIRIILKEEIKKGNQYTVTYNYQQFGKEKSIQSITTLADNLFVAEPSNETTPQQQNYIPYFISGGVVILAAISGLIFIKRRK